MWEVTSVSNVDYVTMWSLPPLLPRLSVVWFDFVYFHSLTFQNKQKYDAHTLQNVLSLLLFNQQVKYWIFHNSSCYWHWPNKFPQKYNYSANAVIFQQLEGFALLFRFHLTKKNHALPNSENFVAIVVYIHI